MNNISQTSIGCTRNDLLIFISLKFWVSCPLEIDLPLELSFLDLSFGLFAD